MFSSPKVPTVEVPETVEPTVQQPSSGAQEQDTAVSQAREGERRRRLRASAANDTLVTGAQGVTTNANTAGKQLYGV